MLALSPIFYLCKQLKIKKEIREQENAIPKYSDISYFRDKVGRISPGVLSFVLNKKINYKDDAMATIFSLMHKKYVQIENNKITKTTKETDNLDNNEKYILSSFRFAFSSREFRKYWKNYVMSDSVNHGYMEKFIRESNENYDYIVLIGVIFVIISPLIFNLDENFLLWYLQFALFVITILTYTRISEETPNRLKYVRTEKGQDLYIKLIGLKKFLKDFTLINEKQRQELYLWDDYMIYAIIFNLPGLLNREIKEEFSILKRIELLPYKQQYIKFK